MPNKTKSRFRESDANYTRLGSVTVDSQKEKLTNPHMGDTMYVNLLGDDSFDLDINVEEISDEDYNPENDIFKGGMKNLKVKRRDLDSSDDGSKSRLARLGERNMNRRSPKDLIKKKRRIDVRERGTVPNNKTIHQPKLGYSHYDEEQ